MASLPPAQCCTIGVKHEGEPSGAKSTIAGKYEAYIAEPTGKNIHKDAAILFLPDVIGIWQNSQLLADQFAANGYYTIILDTFLGDSIPLNRPADFDMPAWRAKHTVDVTDPIVLAGIDFLRKEKGFTKIGSVGYCFGGKFVARFLGKGIDAGFTAHPSFLVEEELRNIGGPFSIAAAEDDGIFTIPLRHKSEEILKATSQRWQINLFSNVSHGFAVRCDPSVNAQRFAKEQAFYQAVTWFDNFII